MSHPKVNGRSLALIAIASSFLCEAAAALPFLASEVIWASARHALAWHLAAAFLVGGGAAALFASRRGFMQWAGPTVRFTLLAAPLPVLGLIAILLLTLILASHHAREMPEEI
jgi:hypothetical protein